MGGCLTKHQPVGLPVAPDSVGTDAVEEWERKVDRVSRHLVQMMGETAITEGLLSLLTDHVYKVFSDSSNKTQRSFAVFCKLRWLQASSSKDLGAEAEAMHTLCRFVHDTLGSDMGKMDGDRFPLLMNVEEVLDRIVWDLAQKGRPNSGGKNESDGKSDARDQPDAGRGRVCAIQFLARVHKVVSVGGPPGAIVTSAQSRFKHQLVQAWMAFSTASSTRDSKTKVAFVGQESIGKSTLINFLVDSGGNGQDLLPVGTGMVTQTLTIVHPGTFTSLAASDQGDKAQNTMNSAEIYRKLDEESRKIKKLRQKKGTDLLNQRYFHIQKPWAGHSVDEDDVELIDVPGYKPDTKLETSLALGVAQVLVLCAGEADGFKLQLSGGELCDLPGIFSQVKEDTGISLPIVVAVTRGNRESFEASGDQYKEIMKTHFNMDEFPLIYANCFDFHATGCTIGMGKCILQMLDAIKSCEISVPKPATELLTSLHAGIINSVRTKETAFYENHVDILLKQYSDIENIAFLPALADVVGEERRLKRAERVTCGKELSKLLANIVPKKEDIPIFKILIDGEVGAARDHEAELAEAGLLESRIAFLRVTIQLTGKIFGDMWKAFNSFLGGDDPKHSCSVEQEKIVDEFCDCLLITSGGERTDWNALNTVQEWTSACGHHLSKCRPNGFHNFVAGYYLACIDFELKNEFLAALCGTGGDKKLDPSKADLLQFPRIERTTKGKGHSICSNFLASKRTTKGNGPSKFVGLDVVIEEFHKNELKEQVRAIKTTLKLGDADGYRAAQLACCLQSARHCAEKIVASTVFSPMNPFVLKLVEFSCGMLQRFFIRFDARTGKFLFTDFKYWLDKKQQEGNLSFVRKVIDICPCEHATPKEKYEAMGTALSVLVAEVEARERNNDVDESISKLAETVKSEVGRARKQVPHEVESGADVFVSWISSDVISTETRGHMEKVFKDKGLRKVIFQSTGTAKLCDTSASVLPEIQHARPLIVVLVRCMSRTSTTPTTAEGEFFDKVLNIPSVGSAIWVWHKKTEATGSACNHLEVDMTGEPSYTTEQIMMQAAEPLAIKVEQMSAEARQRVRAERTKQIGEFDKTLANLMKTFQEYYDKKRIAVDVESVRDVIRSLTAGANKAKLIELDKMKETEFSIALPPKTVLESSVFVSEAAAVQCHGQSVKRINEVKVRSFLHTVLVGQIVKHAETIAGRIFDEVIAVAVANMAKAVRLRQKELLDYIDVYHQEQEQPKVADPQKSVAGDNAGMRPADANLAEASAFLKKESFVSMYIGGTVLSLMPLLTALVVPELTPSVTGEPGLPQPSEQPFLRRKESALKAINTLKMQ